ncbi:MAG TPA: Ig-like domain-containing protein [Dokdonella sp.]
MPIVVPNGDFSSPANDGSVGGGALQANGTNVPIGSGPWTGTYHGVLGVVAPPLLTISSATGTATISGLLGISALGLVNNGGYFGQTLTVPLQPNTRYILSADIQAGQSLLQLGLLDATHSGIQLVAGGDVLASSDTAAPGLVTLDPIGTTSYRLALIYESPAKIAADPIELRLFAQPQGLLTANLLPTITFSHVALDAVVHGEPAAVGEVSGDGQTAVVGTAFDAPLGVHVVDGTGAPVSNVEVTFTAPAAGAGAVFSADGNSGPTLTVLTDANGDAIVDASANMIAGSYEVSVQVAGLAEPQIFHLNNAVGPPSVVGVSQESGGGEQSTTVGTPFAHPLEVEVTDAYGNPVPGVVVTFTAPASGASAVLSASTATTGKDGRAAVDASANAMAGGYVVTASVAGVAAPAEFDLTNVAGTQAGIAASGGGGQSTAVGTPFAQPLSARVVDEFNNPVPGVTVAFGVGAAENGASATLSAPSAVTGADGVASVVAVANGIAGSYLAVASVDGVGAVAPFALTNTAGLPAQVEAVGGGAQSTEVGTPFPRPLEVRVRDAFGNPVPNVAVAFVAQPAASGASATLSAPTANTGADGVARVDAVANAVAGSYSVQANVVGASAATFVLTNTAGAPAVLEIGAGGSGVQSTEVGTPFPAPLLVRVADSHGNPVAGIAVAFAAPTAGASATLSAPSAVSGADGEASVAAIANTVAGHYVVIASVSGVGANLVFDLTNTPGAPHDVVPIGGDGSVGGGAVQSTPVYTAFPQPLKVRVRDEYQNPVPGVQATFAAPTSGPSAELSNGAQIGTTLVVATDANGEASVVATANGRTGTYTVVAQVAGTAAPVVFQLTNTQGNSVTPVGGSAQSVATGEPFACALIVRLADPQGQPRAGVAVDFAAPADGPSALLSTDGGAGAPTATATTDADGVAWVEAVANDIPGSYVVTARESGDPNAQVVSFTLTNLDPSDPIFRNGFDPACGAEPPQSAPAPAR